MMCFKYIINQLKTDKIMADKDFTHRKLQGHPQPKSLNAKEVQKELPGHIQPKELEAHPEPMGLPAHEKSGTAAAAGIAAAAMGATAAAAGAANKPSADVETADVDNTPKYVKWGAIGVLALVVAALAGLFLGGRHWNLASSEPQMARNTVVTKVNSPTGTSSTVDSPAPTSLFLVVMGDDKNVEIGDENADVAINATSVTLPDVDVIAQYDESDNAAAATSDAATATAATAPTTSATATAAAKATAASNNVAASGASGASADKMNVICLFGFDSAEVQDTKALENLAAEAKKSGRNVVIKAYTDEVGNVDYNKALSMRRAKAVSDYLVAHGVPADHISTQGMGPTHAFATNARDRYAQVTLN